MGGILPATCRSPITAPCLAVGMISLVWGLPGELRSRQRQPECSEGETASDPCLSRLLPALGLACRRRSIYVPEGNERKGGRKEFLAKAW